MKKFTKKLLSVAIAVVMVMSMGTAAFADTVSQGDSKDVEVIKAVTDGTYDVTTNLAGGTGKLKINDAKLNAADGKMSVTLVLSSKSYSKLKVSDVEYDNQNAGGNSTFTFPVSELDAPIAISGYTTAMSDPHWIDYTLTLSSEGVDSVMKPASDGEYSIEVETGEKMFKVVDAVLKVKDGKMTAVVTLSGTGYTYLYAGNVADTNTDTLDTVAEADRIPVKGTVTTAEGKEQAQYEIPVDTLNAPMDFGAFSAKNKVWYARTLTFKADTLKSYEPPKGDENDKTDTNGSDKVTDTKPGNNDQPVKSTDDNKTTGSDGKTSQVPKTSDSENLPLMLFMLAASAGTLTFLYKKRSNI